MYNADFNAAAYEEILLEAGLNRFIMSVKQWVSRTNSKGIVAKAGRYGGTYAYKDIAFEFASWVSPQFKLYLIKGFEVILIPPNSRELKLLQFKTVFRICIFSSRYNPAYSSSSSIAKTFKAHS